MSIKCYSVRLKSLEAISDKAFKAVAFDGSSDIIPASMVYGQDEEVKKSEAWWISAWILEKKKITYSTKKVRWFEYQNDGLYDSDYRNRRPSVIITKHIPSKIKPVEKNEISSLKSE